MELHGSTGKLSDAQRALTSAIERLESSLSKDQELCKVHSYGHTYIMNLLS